MGDIVCACCGKSIDGALSPVIYLSWKILDLDGGSFVVCPDCYSEMENDLRMALQKQRDRKHPNEAIVVDIPYVEV